ncbi:MAG TPA: SMC family ATPase [Pyrinomonadaceae bacterium]|nr:SMC family ATPase [Pyrinomonadaceae bacterium]
MHITKVELENIKSHGEAKFEFQRGTTAITGTNGAGKTTIIEAVAWTLFDLLDYKKDDFVKRGKKKGSVNVTFESSLDERRYTVYRDTGTGYYVYDPQLKMRVAEKKDEVTSFIRQHLGVEAGTDLESLFRRAIGVPQGTFTAIFLESVTERKKAFDKLLKVEEYRQGAEKLRETARYIEVQTNFVRERIARAEGELSRFESLETERTEISANIKELEKNLAFISKEIESKTKIVADFDQVEKQLNELRSSHEKLKFELESAKRENVRIEAEFERAKTASNKLKAVEKEHLTHLSALGELSKLEHQRTERDKVQTENSQVESKIINAKSEAKRLTEALQKAHEAGQQIAQLEPQIKQQHDLEKEKEALRTKISDAKSVQNQINDKQKEIDIKRKEFSDNKAKLDEAEKKSALAVNLQTLLVRDTEITNELAKLRANLERDEQFQREIKNGLCPILSQKCLNLKPGETLESFVKSQFSGSKVQITTLESEQNKVSVELQTARDGEKYLTALESYKLRESQIKEDGIRLKNDIENLQKLLADLPNLQKEADAIETKLRELNNPRERAAALKREADSEASLRDKQREIEKVLEELDRERLLLAEKLEQFAEVEILLKKFQTERDQTLSAHRDFLANEALANSFPQREKEFSEIIRKVTELEKSAENSIKELAEFEKKYDRDAHQTEKVALINSQTREAETKTRLQMAKERQVTLKTEIERLQQVREEMKDEFAEKERLEKIYEATKFIRDTLKEAAPRVARNYVFHISNEANQLFREITGNAERTLKWGEDYGIVLEEVGYERPFANLSGGEQMAAALSVRLALLKQLSDVRIAFFDEPTTNMDAERRENLATQISNIKHFDQLFVISHDDTFEGYVDNVISINGSNSQG